MAHHRDLARSLPLYAASSDGTFWATEQAQRRVLGAGTDKRGRLGEEAQQHVIETTYQNRS